MVESFPYGMFAFPLREVIRLHSALGPEGKPLVIGYTRNDLAQWGRLVARQLAASGVTDGNLLRGVRFFGHGNRTHSLVISLRDRLVRFVDSVHLTDAPDAVVEF